MFIKVIISIIIAPIIFIAELFNFLEPATYVAKETPAQIIENREVATSTEPKIEVKKEEKATTTVKIAEKPKETPKIETPVVPVVQTPPQINIPPADFEKINTDSRKTIINILCSTKYNDLSPISGTGVLISSDGLILTNAHIGQYLLLKDFREKDYLKCVGRVGSPAYPRFNLELVYISPNWVEENKTLLKEQNPTGTGEYDFAFLRITGNIDGTPTPNFAYIEPNTREFISKGEPVLLASYPAGFLGGISILQDLNITTAITNIQDVFTFDDGSIDVISVGGTVVSQKGSSGGLVVDSATSLIGIITTSSDGQTTSSRGLNAITVSYINRSLQKEISLNFKQFLETNHAIFAKEFNENKAPALSTLIINELTKQN